MSGLVLASWSVLVLNLFGESLSPDATGTWGGTGTPLKCMPGILFLLFARPGDNGIDTGFPTLLISVSSDLPMRFIFLDGCSRVIMSSALRLNALERAWRETVEAMPTIRAATRNTEIWTRKRFLYFHFKC